MIEEYRPKTMETTGPNPSPLYIKNPAISQVPYLQRISPDPYLFIEPSTLMTWCDFFIYLYIGDLSHDRYQSFSREVMCVLTVHLPYSFLIFMIVRTGLANKPTEPMLVSLRARYTKLCGNRGFLRSGSRQTTPVRVGVTCGSGISAIRVDRK